MLNFMKNWNRYYKLADEPDMGKREALRWLCVALYTWALQLYQTLPNFASHRAIICYSFLCLVDRVRQFMHTRCSDHNPTSQTMLSRALQMAKPVMTRAMMVPFTICAVSSKQCRDNNRLRAAYPTAA